MFFHDDPILTQLEAENQGSRHNQESNPNPATSRIFHHEELDDHDKR